MPFANVVVKKYLKKVDRLVTPHAGSMFCYACFAGYFVNLFYIIQFLTLPLVCVSNYIANQESYLRF